MPPLAFVNIFFLGMLGDPHGFRAGGRIRSGPLVGKVAT